MADITGRGSFVLPSGKKSTLVDMHISKIERGPNEPGLNELTGWASVPADFVPGVMAHWIETGGEAELLMENGANVPIIITNTVLNETGRAIVRFARRGE